MSLTVRLVRALWVLGIIFASYVVQLGLVRVFRRFERNAQTGREDVKIPRWLKDRRKRVDAKNAKCYRAG